MLGVIVAMLAATLVVAPAVAQPSALWRDIPERQVPARGERRIVPRAYRTLEVNLAGLEARLAQAPVARASEARTSRLVLELPLPSGTTGRFHIAKSTIMEPDLAAEFPEITTYIGYGIDDASAVARLDLTPAGFHAMILSHGDTVFIDPYSTDNTINYISYRRSDYPKPADKQFVELTAEAPQAGVLAQVAGDGRSAGGALRTYRLAVAATGEYTAFSGGTVSAAMAAIVTTINRVDGVYERDLDIHLVLVANNSKVVFTNASTDPFDNFNGGSLVNQSQSTIDSLVGSANYDIGHVFSTGGGGYAIVGCTCVGGSKAKGQTGSSRPVGDAFDIDYVAHEMGHQLGAIHTFNGTTGSCGGGNRTAGSAYEPGSGTTIMAYAGICGAENLQPNSDDYFHTTSFDEIQTYMTTGNGRLCGTLTSTANGAPSVSAGQDYTIPAQTPFKLVGAGADPNGDTLTYTWEQFNLGTASPPSADDGTRPLFRSFKGIGDPARVLPRMSDILNNTSTIGEVLPTTNRTLTFRLTARDNRTDGGGVSYDTMNVTVAASAGPFRVTAPDTSVTWAADSVQTVTWNVANTDAAPVNSPTVDIVLSTDGGATWSTLLAASTPNDGAETISVPALVTSEARLMVRSATSIFFDIGNANFSISPAEPTATPTVEATPSPTDAGGAVTPTATPTDTGGSSTPLPTSTPSTTPSSTPLPTSTPTAIPSSTPTPTTTRTPTPTITRTPTPTPLVLTSPASLAAQSLSLNRIALTWTDRSSIEQGFQIQRSTNNTTFSTIFTTAQNAVSYTDSGLVTNVTYYYRVRAVNGAVVSNFSNTASAKARR